VAQTSPGRLPDQPGLWDLPQLVLSTSLGNYPKDRSFNEPVTRGGCRTFVDEIGCLRWSSAAPAVADLEIVTGTS
jgi:hypothetical protein